MRLALALACLVGAAGALDVPAGAMPDIDGVPGEAEWRGAARVAQGDAEACLRVSGRVLCVALRVRAPYRGERIDFYVSDADGENPVLHQYHPACWVPQGRSPPIAPVTVRRGRGHLAAPYSSRFRSRVLKEAGEWTAEFAIAMEALDVSPARRTTFRLEVVHPFGRTEPRSLTTPRPGDAGPAAWEELSASWKRDGALFDTPEEDARRAFELEIFREAIDVLQGREPSKPVLSACLDDAKRNDLIDNYAGRLRGCIEADPGDFFAHHSLAHLLLRANRLAEAERALGALRERFPRAWELPPVLQVRVTLLATLGRFDELPEAMRRPMAGLAAQWREEQRMRAKPSGEPRLVLETTKGRIVVEPYDGTLAKVLRGFEGAELAEVTGALGALVPLKAAADGPRESARLAWRGTVSLQHGETPGLFLATGHAHLARPLVAVGRIVDGMDVVDALEAGDRVEAVKPE